MKKLILFLTLIMSLQFVFGSVLEVKLPNNKFRVILDGVIYNPTANLHFDRIHPGTKNITIIREGYDGYGNCISRTVFDGCINVPQRSRVVAEFYRGNMDVQTQPLGNYGNPCGQCGQHHNGGACPSAYNGNNGYGGNGCGTQPVVCGNCGQSHHGGTCGNNRNNIGGAATIIQLMADETFDNDRLTMGMTYVRNNYATSEDIRRMALLFTFDSNRLKFAKKAYASCVDPQAYYLVATTFTFSSNKRALLDYIG